MDQVNQAMFELEKMTEKEKRILLQNQQPITENRKERRRRAAMAKGKK